MPRTSISSPVEATAAITGGTINGATIGATTPAAITGTTITGPQHVVTGAVSSAAWTTAGVGFKTVASTYTDTSSSGTVALTGIHAFGIPTIAASSATTFTRAANVYIGGAPTAGTNVTISNGRALYVLGATEINGSTTINTNNGSSTSSIGTGSTTGQVSIGGASNNVLFNGGSALATTATAGFPVFPTCAGAPTGSIAASGAGNAYIVYDTTNSKLWINTSGSTTWKGVVLS